MPARRGPRRRLAARNIGSAPPPPALRGALISGVDRILIEPGLRLRAADGDVVLGFKGRGYILPQRLTRLLLSPLQCDILSAIAEPQITRTARLGELFARAGIFANRDRRGV